MIAALQMYDWPEVQPRLDAYWGRCSTSLRAHGVAVPATLSRPDSIASTWTRPDLLLGQTCGLPYVSGRCSGSRLLARPVFNLPGAPDGNYSSALICRQDDPARRIADFQGRTAAINEYGSQSGCNALADAVLDHATDAPFFSKVILSGAHRLSACSVADGTCDIAAIDAVAWALFAEVEPQRHARLRVLGWTRPMPALPFITSASLGIADAILFDALRSACSETPAAPIPVSVMDCEDHDYDPIRAMAARIAGMQLAPNTPVL